MTQKSVLVTWKRPVKSGAVKKEFTGSWRITALQGCDADYVDLWGPARLKINAAGSGRLNFGAVNVELDCKIDDLDERVLRFTFEGLDEGDTICGRGYCVLNGDELAGRIIRHLGDDFGFRARRLAKKAAA